MSVKFPELQSMHVVKSQKSQRMADKEERECIITAILSLRKARREISDYESEDFEENKSRQTQTQTQKQNDINMLPDAVIQHVILSYRPFCSLRVVLIRGDDDTGSIPRYREPTRREYSLTFQSNRGPLRFRVVELPYLPPRHVRSSSSSIYRDTTSTIDDNGNRDDDAMYRTADGVIISCYIARFFEYCDRYGFNYASSSILNDVADRQATPPSSNANSREEEEDDGRQAESFEVKKTNSKTVVLCGNDIDVTHVDAKVSSVVFRDRSRHDLEKEEEEEEELIHPPTSFIDDPRHPFATLARSVTNDNGLEFVDCTSSRSDCSSKQDDSNVTIDMDTDIELGETKNAKEDSSFILQRKQVKFAKHDNRNQKNWNWLRAQVSS